MVESAYLSPRGRSQMLRYKEGEILNFIHFYQTFLLLSCCLPFLPCPYSLSLSLSLSHTHTHTHTHTHCCKLKGCVHPKFMLKYNPKYDGI